MQALYLISFYLQYIRVQSMKKQARTYIIQQDEHLQNLRKIIKRDFFGTTTAQQQKQTVELTLNDYLSNYKSNQNQFFSQMVQTNNQQWKKNHWWIDKQDKMLMIANSDKFDALPYHNMLQNNVNINGINTSITKQQAKNSFFFNRQNNFGSLQSTEYQQSKKVVYANCKLNDSINRMRQQIKQQEVTPQREEDHWEKESKKQHKRKEVIQGSPQPQDDGHLMTWGEIQTTPMRIAGPQFRIPQTPQRQIILNNLNHKMNKQKMQAPKKSEYVMKILGSLTPSLNSRVLSKNRYNSSVRRANESVNRAQVKKAQKSQISGLLNIKK